MKVIFKNKNILLENSSDEEYKTSCLKNFQLLEERIIDFFDNQEGKIIFTLAIPHNFFTIEIKEAELQSKFSYLINNLPEELKNWIR